MTTLLWILAVVLVVAVILTHGRGQILLGIALIVIGHLVRPGGITAST